MSAKPNVALQLRFVKDARFTAGGGTFSYLVLCAGQGAPGGHPRRLHLYDSPIRTPSSAASVVEEARGRGPTA